MKIASNLFRLFTLSFLTVFVLSSCIANTRTGNETSFPPNAGSQDGTSFTDKGSISNGETEQTTTAAPTKIPISEVTLAQEAAETYFELMEAQKYAEAYQMLSPLTPHLKTLEEFVLEADTFYESYRLLSIESYPAWSATVNAGTPSAKMLVENDRCKRFIVEVKVEYKEGIWGAGPSGTYPYALTVINDENGWKIVQIDTIPDPLVCEKY